MGFHVENLIYYLTRTFAYSLHREKQILAGNWPYQNTMKKRCKVRETDNSISFSGVALTRPSAPEQESQSLGALGVPHGHALLGGLLAGKQQQGPNISMNNCDNFPLLQDPAILAVGRPAGEDWPWGADQCQHQYHISNCMKQWETPRYVCTSGAQIPSTSNLAGVPHDGAWYNGDHAPVNNLSDSSYLVGLAERDRGCSRGTQNPNSVISITHHSKPDLVLGRVGGRGCAGGTVGSSR